MYGAKARVQSKQVVERLKGLAALRVRWLLFHPRFCHMVFLSRGEQKPGSPVGWAGECSMEASGGHTGPFTPACDAALG